ncbi:Protein of unknown function DUF900 [Babesia duncani]|uniref:Uncharacterized protein n=1 Tax=Babesia duncani TaxID=323732 RepID=A0AAD9PI44_9APIC|nr:Protein of unknown function DUF900 [Babesia duncani]KAK2194771.1 Protein of unknown function DUF900 [Babesia duncani]KAK2195124.1 Protein of unknown function DUF900 [Babesia duncani]
MDWPFLCMNGVPMAEKCENPVTNEEMGNNNNGMNNLRKHVYENETEASESASYDNKADKKTIVKSAPEKCTNPLMLANAAMQDTLHYMKYRERLRWYNGEYRKSTYVECMAHIICVFSMILLFDWASRHFETLDPEIKVQGISWFDYYMRNPNDLMYILFGFTLFISSTMLYVCAHPVIYFYIVILSKMTFILYLLMYPFLMVYNHTCNIHASHETKETPLKMIFNARAYKIWGPFYYDTLILTIYSILVLLYNIWASFYWYISPHLLFKTLCDELKSYKVVYMEKVSFDVPNYYVEKSNANSVEMEGYHIKIAKCNALNVFNRLINNIITRFSSKHGYSKNDMYQYIGQVNSKFKPNGFGYWRGTLPQGEMLIGCWENGLPLGPFKSRELKSGSGFTNCLIGWMENGNIHKSLSLGVASIECCVNGSFFRSFPRAMLYRSEFFNDNNVDEESDGILKHLGKVPNEEITEYVTNKRVVMRLYKVTNDIVQYTYGKTSKSLVQNLKKIFNHKVSTSTLMEKIKYNKQNKTDICFGKICDQIGGILQALSTSSPNFVSYDINELHISLDPSAGLHIRGYVPLNYEHGADSVTIKVGEVPTITEGNFNNLPHCLSGPHTKHQLLTQGWGRKQDMGYLEVLIYIHGFCVTSENAMRVMGQVIAFGNYPDYIKPFVFSWPSGNSVTHIKMALSNSVSAEIRARFVLMLQSLVKNGVSDIHVITHSMGTKMFLDAFIEIINSQKTSNLFISLEKSNQEKGARNIGQLRLLTLTMFNPEYCLETFKRSTFKQIRQYCDHITIYSDLNDRILWITETLTRKRRLGRAVYEVFFNQKEIDVENSGSSSLKYSLKKEETTVTTLGSIMMPFYQLDSNLQNTDSDDQVHWLDLDVIDTTWLESNVHATRHSYWFINREIAEDLRELIVCRKRARQRMSRLDRSIGNVWVYRIAPTNFTTIYKHRF